MNNIRLTGLIFLILISGCKEIITEEEYCTKDSDCVAAGCCHASSCVNIEFKPDCEDIACTMDCAPGTMDCGQGYCRCVDKRCAAIMG